DVADVEGVLVQRPDRRALVDVDVVDPELLALLQVGARRGVRERPAARALAPLGGVELDALDAVARVVFLELTESRLAVTGVEAPVDFQLAREALQQRRVLVDRVEAVDVPLLEVRRLEDADVDIALV